MTHSRQQPFLAETQLGCRKSVIDITKVFAQASHLCYLILQVLTRTVTSAMERRTLIWAACVFVGTSAHLQTAGAVAPAGPNIRVSTQTTGTQDEVAVAADASGGFVVVWHNSQDEVAPAIYGRRFSSNGTPLGSEFPISAVDTSFRDARRPDISMDATGAFVVAWEARQFNSATGFDVLARRFSGDGTPQGDPFVVNEAMDGNQGVASIALSNRGSFIITWSSSVEGNEPFSTIWARRYFPDGQPAGSSFQVSNGPLDASGSDVAVDPEGNFWIAFLRFGTPMDIFLRRYSRTGNALSPAIQVNSSEFPSFLKPSIAVTPSGECVVAWGATDSEFRTRVFAQQVDSNGGLKGPEILISGGSVGSHHDPSISTNVYGDFAVSWRQIIRRTDGVENYVLLRSFTSGGQPLNEATRINPDPIGRLRSIQSATAMDADGDFIVAWNVDTQTRDRASDGVFFHRYVTGTPRDISVAMNDEVDPISVPGTITLNVRLRNLEPPMSDTGFPRIDAALNSEIGPGIRINYPAGLSMAASFAGFEGPRWNCADRVTLIECEYDGALDAGAHADVAVRFDVSKGSTGTSRSVAKLYLAPGGADSNPDNNRATERTILK